LTHTIEPEEKKTFAVKSLRLGMVRTRFENFESSRYFWSRVESTQKIRIRIESRTTAGPTGAFAQHKL